MPWTTVNKMELRREFVELASAKGANMRQLCLRYGISRPTGYKWLRRWECEGEAGLEERSRRPKASPRRSKESLERAVLKVREDHPSWGGRKIGNRLRKMGRKEVPAYSTITEVLRRHGKLNEAGGEKPGQGPWKRFTREAPNDLWQMDFKGHFGTQRGPRCHPLTVLDDHSRFNLILSACGNERTATVQERLREAFMRYGLPAQILCDNAPPWGVPDRSSRYTELVVWLMERGVEVIHGRPYHPQTQGKEERFHRTLNVEVISRKSSWQDLAHCQREFVRWRETYNHERPHESLGDDVPAEHYKISERILPPTIAEPESYYLGDDQLRRVKSKGEITFRNHFFYIGQAFIGKTIALRPCGDAQWEVYYCWKSLGKANFKALTKEKYRYEPLQ